MKKSILIQNIEKPTDEEKCIKLLYESLKELISQKAIGNMVFDISKLNEGFILAERILKPIKKRI